VFKTSKIIKTITKVTLVTVTIIIITMKLLTALRPTIKIMKVIMTIIYKYNLQ